MSSPYLALLSLGVVLWAPTIHAQDAPPDDLLPEEPVEGRLAKGAVAATIRENLPAIRLCFQRALEDQPGLQGVVAVEFVIEADGSVSSAELSHSSMDQAEMEACVCERVQRLRFPEPEGGGSVVVTHPFAFNGITPDSEVTEPAEAADAEPPLGKLPKKVIDETIKANLQPIKACYQTVLNRRPNLHGKVTVRFVIGCEGTVTSAEVKETTLNNDKVETCVCDAIADLTFPPPDGGGKVIVTYPFVFQTP